MKDERREERKTRDEHSSVGAGSELGSRGRDDGIGDGSGNGAGSTDVISNEETVEVEKVGEAHATTAPEASTVETAPPTAKASFLLGKR